MDGRRVTFRTYAPRVTCTKLFAGTTYRGHVVQNLVYTALRPEAELDISATVAALQISPRYPAPAIRYL